SSENRSMALNTFDRLVPPLKMRSAGGSGREKIVRSVQHTQKSFSITSARSVFFCRAASVNKSARSRALSRATSSMSDGLHLGFVCGRLIRQPTNDIIHPVRRVASVVEELLPDSIVECSLQVLDDVIGDIILTQVAKCLEHRSARQASGREVLRS